MPGEATVFMVTGIQVLSGLRVPCGDGAIGVLWSQPVLVSGIGCKVITVGVTEVPVLGLELHKLQMLFMISQSRRGFFIYFVPLTLLRRIWGCCSPLERMKYIRLSYVRLRKGGHFMPLGD